MLSGAPSAGGVRTGAPVTSGSGSELFEGPPCCARKACSATQIASRSKINCDTAVATKSFSRVYVTNGSVALSDTTDIEVFCRKQTTAAYIPSINDTFRGAESPIVIVTVSAIENSVAESGI
jgi:hypothetical protein